MKIRLRMIYMLGLLLLCSGARQASSDTLEWIAPSNHLAEFPVSGDNEQFFYRARATLE